MVFGVSLGFSLFLVWQQFNAARQTAENEATSLQQLHNLAARFPDSEQDRVKELAVTYARVVVDEEWASLQQRRPTERAETLLGELRRSVVDLEPRTNAQDALYAASLQELDELWRRTGRYACSPRARAYRPSCGSCSWSEGRSP